MKSNISFNRLIQSLLASVMLVFCIVPGNTQVERTFSQVFSATHDLPVDGKQLGSQQFVILSNSKPSNAGNRIVLTRTYTNGTAPERVTLFTDQPPNFEFKASAFEVVRNSAGQPTAMYIVGTRSGGNLASLILIKVNISPFAQVAWIRIMDNTFQANPNYFSGEGFSLELQTNGDVIAIGTYGSFVPGNYQSGIMAGRFTSNGNLSWGYRYRFNGGQIYHVNGSCNGTATFFTTIPTVAITGRVEYIDNSRTLAFCINANTGEELFRRQINSANDSDEGHDILQDPVSKNFMIVGQTRTSSTKTSLWVVNINSVSGFPATTGGTVYATPGSTTNLIARSVCLSVSDNSAIIGGYNNGYGCIIKLPFTDNAAFSWARQYPASGGTFNLKSGDIARVEAIGATTRGYLLTTDVIYSLYNASHAVYVSETGGNGAACQPENFTTFRSSANTRMTLGGSKTPVLATSAQVVRGTAAVSQINCQNLGGASDERSADNQVWEMDGPALEVFPNPVYGGQDFIVKFKAALDSDASLQLFDMTGKLVSSNNTEVSELVTEVKISTLGLSSGLYFLRAETVDGLKTIRVVVGKN